METKFSKLKTVDLRKGWPHEEYDFSKWLAQEENLKLLGEEIGIEIVEPQTEVSVGKFSVDILAEEQNTGRKIIIENQLGTTNHDHLGKIITYASGIDAEIIIWIVKDASDEHLQAVNWLNNNTNEKIRFFLIKIEIWQIDDSNFAPKFNLLVEPNEWQKTVKIPTSETKTVQLEFWNKFRDYALTKTKKIKLRKPRPQHWYDLSIGSANVNISLTVRRREGDIGCEIYIHNNKDLFVALKKAKNQIEKEIGSKLIWMPLEEKMASRIKITKHADLMNKNNWETYFDWFIDTVLLFQKVFPKFIKKHLSK